MRRVIRAASDTAAKVTKSRTRGTARAYPLASCACEPETDDRNPSRLPSTHAKALESPALRARLHELVRHERATQVDFLLHLAEFDARRAFIDAGFNSVWNYCLRELHLREGPAARRIGAMRALSRHPGLEAPLRDGRLCLSTVTLVAPLLREMELDAVLARAAYKTKEEVEQFVVSVRPRTARRDGVRQLPQRRPATPEVGSGSGAATNGTQAKPPAPEHGRDSSTASAGAAAWSLGMQSGRENTGESASRGDRLAFPRASTPVFWTSGVPAPVPAGPRERGPDSRGTPAEPEPDHSRVELTPVAAAQWSLRVKLDADMKADLDMLQSLLSHKSGRDLAEVIREALRCGIEKHGKRRGAVAPSRVASKPAAAAAARAVTVAAAEPAAAAAAAAAAPVRAAAAPVRAAAPAAAGAAPAPSAAESKMAPAVPAETARDSDGGDPAAKARGTTAVTPCARAPQNPPRKPDPRAISAETKRAVWARDGQCCAWKNVDGTRCGSRWKLEIDHITPVALGGTSDVGNLRLVCRAHNVAHAEHIFGRRHMAKFRRSY